MPTPIGKPIDVPLVAPIGACVRDIVIVDLDFGIDAVPVRFPGPEEVLESPLS
jgi:hypothetical protein